MLTDSDANHAVILRPDIHEALLSYFDSFTISVKNDRTALKVLLCTAVDESHFYYLKAETFRPGDEDTFPLRIPHQFVLAIDGIPALKRGIGYMLPDAKP